LASELAHAAGARGLVDDAGRGAGEEAHVVGIAKPYVTGYEPIRDAANNIIGIYFVGYAK